MRKWLTWTGTLLLVPILLVFLFAILLYIPPVQNLIVQKAAGYASEASGMDIGIRRMHLRFPLRLTVSGLEVVSHRDTLVRLRELSVQIRPMPLIRKVVSISSLQIKEAQVDTGDFLDGLLIKGSLSTLSAEAEHIGWVSEEATLNSLEVGGAAVTLRIDSLGQGGSTSTAVNWKIRLEKVDLEHICFALQMPADSLRLSTYIGRGGLRDGLADLGTAQYSLDKLTLEQTDLYYDADERSALSISSLTGTLHSDSTAINIPELRLTTLHSALELTATLPWSILEGSFSDTLQDKRTAYPPAESIWTSRRSSSRAISGHLNVTLSASIGKEDMLTFARDLPPDFRKAYPDTPLNLKAEAEGNLQELTIRRLSMELANALRINASGRVGEVMDSLRRSADIRLEAEADNLGFALACLPGEQRERLRMPRMRLTGEASLQDRAYNARLHLQEGEGSVSLSGSFHEVGEVYEAALEIDNLQLIHFLPKDSILHLTASMKAAGRGLNFFADSTRASLTGAIDHLVYHSLSLSDISLTGSLTDHQIKAELTSRDTLALLTATINGSIRQDDIQAMLIVDAERLDLHGMHLMDSTFHTSFQVFAEGGSDLAANNRLDVSLGNWEIVSRRQRYQPKMLTLHARTTPDTSRVSLHAGDLGIILTGNAGLSTLMGNLSDFAGGLTAQLAADSTFDINLLRPLLPDMSLSVSAGKDNPVYHFLEPYYIGFSQFSILAETSPHEGLRMDAGIFSLYRDTFLIDTVRATIRPSPEGLIYTTDVQKKKYRQQQPFQAYLRGTFKKRYADAELLFSNQHKETGLLLGISARKDSAGFLFHLYPEEPVIGFNKFRLNTDNYLRFKSIKEIDANIRFRGEENASLWFHTVDNPDTYPELHVELSQINLDTLSAGLDLLPKLKGMLSADLRYAPTHESFMLVADANIDTLYYEQGRIGELLFNAVYLPLEKNEHQVDAHLYRDGSEFATATALYKAQANGIEGQLHLVTLPLDMLTPFTGGAAALNGALSGSMAISGSTARPRLNGYVALDTATAYIAMANTRLRFEDKRIEVKDSKVHFNTYRILSSGQNPFVIDGSINIANFSRMTADLRLTANNMQVLDARRTPQSIVYGKLFANLSSTVKGPLSALNIRGDLHVLGGTDATYVMTESALTVQDRLKDLVTFTSFNDTLTRTRRERGRLPLGGMDMLMVIHIDPAVQLRVDITPDRSNYASITGGGDLSFQYTSQGDRVLNGRYTFSEGDINYTLPVIPLKEFHIQNGSYLQWDGEVMNPLLSVKATERMRASARPSGESAPRMVNFDVGLDVQDRLDNMKLNFTISAPEDMAIQNELAAMGAEERSKQAVAMMITGTYLYGGGTGGMNLSAADALNAFLNSEINNIAGDALKGVDLSFGIDTYDDASGAQRRDFSFRFAKRFYNDRIRVIVGGTVSTGGNDKQNDTFLDNVSVEYRLDPAGSRNVKVFHNINYESLLEGQVRETGAGIVFRKKVRYLREMFNFKRTPPPNPPQKGEEPSEDDKENNKQIEKE